jgi:hypothetical protein
MQFSAHRSLAVVAVAVVLAQPAFATEQSVSAIRAIAAPHVASVQTKAPVAEAHLLRGLISIISHFLGHDGGGSSPGDTIHRG